MYHHICHFVNIFGSRFCFKCSLNYLSRGYTQCIISCVCPIDKKLWGNFALNSRKRFIKKPQTSYTHMESSLTLLHSEQPKLHRVLAVLSAIGLKETEKKETLSKVSSEH